MKKNLYILTGSLIHAQKRITKYMVLLLLVAPMHLFAQERERHNVVYSPDEGVVCDNKTQFCVDAMGISLGYTKVYFNQKAQDKLLQKIDKENLPTIQYTFSNSIMCNSRKKSCFTTQNGKKVLNEEFTQMIFYPHQYMQDKLNTIVKNYSKRNHDTAIWLLAKRNNYQYKAVSGYSNRMNQRAAKEDDLFEIGSTSKLFIGVSIFQLLEEGKISLDTKIKKFYPRGEIQKLANFHGKNYWNDVTVGMLLNHTSGFVDYLNVYGNDTKAIELLGGKDKHYTFDEIIHQAVTFGDANFKPGSDFKYCNTGYIILGDIISKVTHEDWHTYIQKNIFDVSGMKHTYFSSKIPAKLRASMPQGYSFGKPTFMPPSLAGSAGEVISSLEDLANFITAWSEGKLYKDANTIKIQENLGFHFMDKNIKNIKYGYAVMKVDNFYGHGGQTFGFESFVAINPQTGDVYVVGTNDAQVRSMDLFMQVAGIKIQKVTNPKTTTYECQKMDNFLKMFDRATDVYHQKITSSFQILQRKRATQAEKKKALDSLKNLNTTTANRQTNSQYPKSYELLKKSVEVSCGNFSKEQKYVLTKATQRSIEFNNILAKILKDSLSISKTK